MDLPHPERHRWVKVISEINRKINASDGSGEGAISQRPLQPPPRGASRVAGGLALRNDPEFVRKALAARAAREALERGES